MLEHIIASIAPHACIQCAREPFPFCDPCISLLQKSPECCYKCGKPARRGLCTSCGSSSSLSSISIRTVYDCPEAKTALRKLKFERLQALARPLASAMAADCPPGLITHVPTAPRRVRQRGYDQAQLIAKNLAHETNSQYKNIFIRTSSVRQLGQTRKVRQQQLANIFQLRNKLPSQNMSIILVDDVLTTGSTVEAAAQVLRHAGYQEIHACIFAWARPK